MSARPAEDVGPGRPGLVRLAAVAAVAAGAAASLWLNWPGHLSYDSVVQMAEGRNGDYGTSGHPPVMSWLLGLAEAITPGAGLFVLLDTLLIAGALAAMVWLGRRPAWPVAALAALAFLIPQLLIYPAIVWKDVLFAATATAGFACLAYAARYRRTPLAFRGLSAGAVGLLALAAMARQNGVVILPFAAAAAGWIATAPAGRGRLWRGAVHGLAFLALSGALITVGAAALSTPTEGGPTAAVRGQFGNLQTYDLVRALVIKPNAKLRVLHARARWFETLLRRDGVAAFSAARIDPLEPMLETVGLHPDSAELIAAQWADLFLNDPWLYLRVRLEASRWVLLSPSAEECVLIYTGIEGPADEMGDAGLTPRKNARDLDLESYAEAFNETPVYSHAVYGAIALALLVGLLRRRLPADIAVAAMLGAALAFSAAFVVISIACDYRYLYDLDLATVAGALYVAATWRDQADGRRLYPRLARAAARRSGS